jgi:trigger factor
MQVTKEQIDPCTVALDIQIEPEKVSSGFERAYREFSRYTSVPGFRPGKAPRKVLENFVNQERLRERVIEIVAGPAYQEALKQENIEPYAGLDPEVDFADLADGEPWQFKAVVPTAPQVTLGKVEEITVERPVYEVTDEDIDRQLDTMRGEHSRVEKVEGRGVEPGDVVIAEMSEQLEGQPPAEPKRTLVRVGENIPGFDEQILGQSIGEERTFTLRYPEDHQNTERAGKEATFTVRVESINQRVLPEATDEWVKETTGLESLQALRDTIRRAQEDQVKDLADRIAEGKILDQLIANSEIHFPGVMVRDEMQLEVQQLERELERQGVTYEQYLQATKMTDDQHRAQLEKSAEDRVKGFLARRELAKRENIEATRDEIAQEFTRLAMESRWSEEDAKRFIRDDAHRQQVANTVILKKLRGRLLELAQVKDVPASEAMAAAGS